MKRHFTITFEENLEEGKSFIENDESIAKEISEWLEEYCALENVNVFCKSEIKEDN